MPAVPNPHPHPHPSPNPNQGADALYVEQVDLGEAAPRQVVSGLVKYLSAEQMEGKLVVLVANMKPSNMRSVLSQAMVPRASCLGVGVGLASKPWCPAPPA